MFWRFCQAAGASPGLALGAGVIGDIYKVEERGTALGIFFGVIVKIVSSLAELTSFQQATLLGPAIAPFVGGRYSYPCKSTER